MKALTLLYTCVFAAGIMGNWGMSAPCTGGGWMRQRCCVSYITRASQLAYSWVRPAILAASKGRGGML